jgi:hypothetical protein
MEAHGHGLALIPVACAAFMVLAAASVAHAQTPEDADEGDARQLFAEGDQAYRVGNYEEAVRFWQSAYAADPRPRIQYNLAQAYERLGRLEEAVTALDSYLRDTPSDDPLYGEANARLSALRNRIALTGVRIVGGTPGGQIFVNEQAWGATPRPDRIPLPPGNHRITIVDPDGMRHQIMVAVPVGQVVDVAVPAGSSPIALSDLGASQPTRSASQQSVGGHVLAWVGVGTAAAGLGVLAYGIERHTKLSGCSDAGFTCLAASPVERQRTAGMVVGGALVAAGAALIVIDLVRRPEAETHADVELGLGLASLSLTVRR